MTADDALIDRIYEAAIVPELWPRVLAELCILAGAWASGLLAFDPVGEMRYVATESYQEAFARFVELGRNYDNQRPKRALASGHAGFLYDTELMTEAELDVDPIYRDFLRPFGVGWTAGTVIPVPSSDLLVFDFAHTLEQGPFDRAAMELLDLYRPHLARSALFAHRLGLEAARTATEALDVVGLPAAVLTVEGRVVAANTAFAALEPHFGIGAFDRLAVEHAPARAMLGSALDGLRTGSFAPVNSIPVPAAGGPAFVAHIVPVRRGGADVFARAAAVLVVTAVSAPEAPLTELLHGLFDLTPAEARLARALSGGATPRQFADGASLSPETVKKQLQAIFSKTGTTRQAALVHLLAGISPLGRRQG